METPAAGEKNTLPRMSYVSNEKGQNRGFLYVLFILPRFSRLLPMYVLPTAFSDGILLSLTEMLVWQKSEGSF